MMMHAALGSPVVPPFPPSPPPLRLYFSSSVRVTAILSRRCRDFPHTPCLLRHTVSQLSAPLMGAGVHLLHPMDLH